MESYVLAECVGCTSVRAEKWCGPLTNAMARFEIDHTKRRQAAFLAQVAHESGGLVIVEENLRYSANGLKSVFRKYFTNAEADAMAQLEDRGERIANIVYGGRMGNTEAGDGWKYRGRGLIQLTGKSNYAAASQALGLDLVGQPDLVREPGAAALTAGWFWKKHGCNELADGEMFVEITKTINGGTIGHADRMQRWARAKTALGLDGIPA